MLLVMRALSNSSLLRRRCAAGALSANSFGSLPGQRLEDVLGKISARYAAALQLLLGQYGQLFVLSGCRIGVGADGQERKDVSTEPSCLVVNLVNSAPDRSCCSLHSPVS